RVMEMLAVGRHIYVDDLVTDEASRGRGYGKAMLDWLKAEAQRLGCERLQLDSGTQRQDAHAFYLRERMRIEAFHFGVGVGWGGWASDGYLPNAESAHGLLAGLLHEGVHAPVNSLTRRGPQKLLAAQEAPLGSACRLSQSMTANVPVRTLPCSGST